MYIKMCIEYWRNDIDRGKTEVLGEKHVPVPLCSSQISHAMISDRTQASAVTGKRLNARVMAKLTKDYKSEKYICIQCSPISKKSTAFWEGPGLRPFILLVRTPVEPFHGKRPHPLLWAGLRAECGKITIRVIPKRLNNCVICTVYT
jgi:hypothetical protein